MSGTASQFVLLASSDPVVVELLEEPLRRYGLDLIVARSLPGARLDVEGRELDTVVLDLEGFGEAALRFIRWVRRRPDTARLPIVIMTGPANTDQTVAGLVAGADNYVAKPIRLPLLRACLDVLTRQSAVLRRARRQGQLLAELAQVEAALDETARRQAELRAQTDRGREPDPRSSVSGEDGSPRSTGELHALKPGSPGEPFGPRDTAELASVDWVLFQAMEAAFTRCVERRRSLSLLMIEALAPEAPDGEERRTFLRAFANRVHSVLREDQTLKPIAGSIFCAVLPETDEPDAILTARRVIEAVEDGPLPLRSGPYPAALAVGVATLSPDFDSSPFQIIDWAHAALYQAKRAGGPGWWVHQPEQAYNP